MIISLTRSSVSMGDDVDAPHKMELNINESEKLSDLIEKIKECDYLASISGGRATWILYLGDTALAVVAQQWRRAKYLTKDSITMDELFNSNKKAAISFRYLAQKDPMDIYNSLK